MARFRVAHVKVQGTDLVLVPLSAEFSTMPAGEKALVNRQVQEICRLTRLAGVVVPVWPTPQGSTAFLAEERLHPILNELLKGSFLKNNINRELQVTTIPAPTSKVLRDWAEPAPVPTTTSPGVMSPLLQTTSPGTPIPTAPPQPEPRSSIMDRPERTERARGRHDDSYPRQLFTMLFTDLIGSTRLKQQLGDHRGMDLIRRHHDLVRNLLSGTATGEEIKTSGDSFFIVFGTPSEALVFALQLQKRLRLAFQSEGVRILDRIGIHVGEVYVERNPDRTLKDLNGGEVDTASRVQSLGTGDQILLSRFAFDNAKAVLKQQSIPEVGPVAWMRWGDYELKGVEERVEICEVGETGVAHLKPPPDGAHGRRIFQKP